MNIPMKIFSRRILDMQINIALSSSLYEKEQTVFISILKLFSFSSKMKIMNDNDYIFYIFDKNDSLLFDKYSHYTICDIVDEKWIFILMTAIETFFDKILNCTVFHGACVKVNGKSILFIGESFSGKSTLSKYFSFDRNGEYLDDDGVYAINNQYFGLGFPIQMRDVTNTQYSEYIVGHTCDGTDTKRTLFQPPVVAAHFHTIDILAFTKYQNSKSNSGTIIELTKAEAFNRLINNIRKHTKMITTYKDVNHLVTNAYCCSLEYSNNDFVYKVLFGNL